MVETPFGLSWLRHWRFLAALSAPLLFWFTMAVVPSFNVTFLNEIFHLWLMVAIAAISFAVAVMAAVASSQVRQPGVVLLACGCLQVGLLLLGHGLTTPLVFGQPTNQWVGRLPLLTLSLLSLCLLLAASRRATRRLAWVGHHPVVMMSAVAIAAGSLTVVVSLWPTALHGSTPIPYENELRQAIVALSVILLVPVARLHWRRYRLGLDIVQLALTLAAVMTGAAMLSMKFADLWSLSWWNYHGCLIAGFAGVSFAVFKRWSVTHTAASILDTAFVDDPLTLIAHNYPVPLQNLVAAMEEKDPYTHGHSARTAELAVAIGVRLNLDPDELRTLAQGAYLHDIGKLGIPDELLNKPGALTSNERKIMQTHPVIGYVMTEGHDVLKPCLPIIRHHHERFDGDGYPDALAADDIPLLARIAAVADVWDALTTDRAYRPGWSPTRALDHMVDGAGKHLDPVVLAVLLEIASEEGHKPSGIGGDSAEIDAATADCHESGATSADITGSVHRLLADAGVDPEG